MPGLAPSAALGAAGGAACPDGSGPERWRHRGEGAAGTGTEEPCSVRSPGAAE